MHNTTSQNEAKPTHFEIYGIAESTRERTKRQLLNFLGQQSSGSRISVLMLPTPFFCDGHMTPASYGVIRASRLDPHVQETIFRCLRAIGLELDVFYAPMVRLAPPGSSEGEAVHRRDPDDIACGRT